MNDDQMNDNQVPMDGGDELSPEEIERRKQAEEGTTEGEEKSGESTEESM